MSDDLKTRVTCVTTQLLRSELPEGASIGEPNFSTSGDGTGYNVAVRVSGGQFNLSAHWRPPAGKPGAGDGCGTAFDDCTEQLGPRGEMITSRTMPDPAYPESKVLFAGSELDGVYIGGFTMEDDKSKRLLSREALIRIFTTPELRP